MEMTMTFPEFLHSLSVEQLLARSELRLRAVKRGIGDPLVHELEIRSIGDEMRRRRDAGIPIS
jgi:hypothetical protein